MGYFDIGNFTVEMENESIRKEFEKGFQEGVEAWNTRDIEAILDSRENLIEFGYRSKEIRDLHKISRSEQKKQIEQFFDIFDSFEAIPISGTVRQIENVVIMASFFKEKMKLKDGQEMEANVRFTATIMKKNGKWKQILAHRDAQFD